MGGLLAAVASLSNFLSEHHGAKSSDGSIKMDWVVESMDPDAEFGLDFGGDCSIAMSEDSPSNGTCVLPPGAAKGAKMTMDAEFEELVDGPINLEYHMSVLTSDAQKPITVDADCACGGPLCELESSLGPSFKDTVRPFELRDDCSKET